MSLVANTSKLAILLPTLEMGGAERAMLNFADGACAHGYDVDLLVCDPRGPLLEQVKEPVRLVPLGGSRVIRALGPLRRYLREERPAALYATVQHANFLAIAAAKFSGAPTKIIVRQSTSHRSEPARTFRHGVMQRLIPWVYPLADGVIAVSNGVCEQLLSANRSLKINVLPNPILTPAFDRLCSEQLSHPWFAESECPVILGAARLHRFKGFASLLRAFAVVRRTRPCRLVILGEGPDRGNLERLAFKLGVQHDVNLPGFVSNPLPYMKRASVFALCSEYEGMPNVLLQAMACGTAVVATDCPSGPREILDGGRRGHLVPIGNESALARAISRALLEGPKPYAAEYVRTHFSVERTVSSYLSIAGLEPVVARSDGRDAPPVEALGAFAG